MDTTENRTEQREIPQTTIENQQGSTRLDLLTINVILIIILIIIILATT